MHNLCGNFNPSLICMEDGICTKQFPKEFRGETGHDNAQLYILCRHWSSACGSKTVPWNYLQAGGSDVWSN